MAIIQPVILAGGTGSRLWPLSRELYPKQLLNLVGDHSLLQATLFRVMGLPGVAPPILVIGEEHRFIAKAQVDALGCNHEVSIILEPMGRNTGPAICAAAFYSQKIHDQPVVLLVLPADHLVRKSEAFAQAVVEAVSLAEAGRLVTFGVQPTSPETGYGYIRKGFGNSVLSFVEKPDLETAEAYLASGDYYWNSGMFAFMNETFIQQMNDHCPEICVNMEQAVANGVADSAFFRLEASSMASSPSDSIDYALMEKSDQVVVVPVDLGWSDIGSWQALWEVSDKDEKGNVASGDVILEGVENCLIRAGHSLVAAVGLTDTMVIETADAVLVAPMKRAQDVKKIVDRLKKDKRDHYKVHQTVFRPWGSYTILEEQENFKIKRITVLPKVKLSLQMHHHRSEHWVVVKGTARVTCGERVFLVMENQSTYIPCGETHRLENPGVIPLELIEVQNGSYLGEDDIVRFDDDFGRQG
ncbi:MAG: mannose-1-phosphate guanylyltransferase/mannose-6-phosphate isomerase [Proteobacteria bacterium]|nr:mannose-1-phosphate guanylyltransferase/mannose-6-phosphate isomerase [Desulfobulbaceae bacterium]MBU4151311.1 mannose-1-phosphate guanylyltransferase/mannose-6-phosphate isomerase [Pseudomonadota bacterium]